MIRKVAVAVGVLALLAVAIVYTAGRGCYGSHEGPGQVTASQRPAAQVRRAGELQADAARAVGVERPKQILFGDLHVHTTFSFDAFLFSLPLLHGEGAHPPADACDFARFCSALDFWSINDHAFSITPAHWRETIDSIRQCNDVGGQGRSPDTVAFLGWEWTQVGTTPENHYGHKNVVLRYTDDARIPKRPITAIRFGGTSPPVLGRGLFALARGGRAHDLARYFSEWEDAPICAKGVDVHDLPDDCIEQAETPAELFHKLDEWGDEAIVIPHGTTWGFYTPPGSSWDKQLSGDMHDPARQTLIEIYSGHGDGEVYRDWRAVEFGPDGTPVCPQPRPDYEPTCWRAGEIIRERCQAAGESAEECDRRAAEARANAAAAGVAAHRTVPGAHGADFLDAGQCRDCEQPAFNYRPGGSAQYILALGNFEAGTPRHFRLGFIASSDNHFARPGTGYKEVHRRGFTESLGGPSSPPHGLPGITAPDEKPVARSRRFDWSQPGFQVFETERQASFLLTGGLVAVHAAGRDRDAIWEALGRREVYGTTGPRILLWFDLVNPPGASLGEVLPMGSQVALDEPPVFRVRAVGSFEQKPGCPDYTVSALSPERLEHLCKGECYNPSDARRRITRIEIVRIQPQVRPGEPVKDLIRDPWRVYDCAPDPAGCAVTFSDPDFVRDERGTVYYARAFEQPEPGINAANLRCETDAAGRCTKVHLCPGPEGDADDCLAPYEPRAWSSPIWVDPGAVRETAPAS